MKRNFSLGFTTIPTNNILVVELIRLLNSRINKYGKGLKIRKGFELEFLVKREETTQEYHTRIAQINMDRWDKVGSVISAMEELNLTPAELAIVRDYINED